MTSTAKRPATRPAEKKTSDLPGDELAADAVVSPGQQEVQDKVAAAQARGYIGANGDETPDEHYAVGGVTAGKSTPENPEGKS